MFEKDIFRIYAQINLGFLSLIGPDWTLGCSNDAQTPYWLR